jgi:hypothetical protein
MPISRKVVRVTAAILVSKRRAFTVGPSLETRTLMEGNCSYYVKIINGLP